VGPPRVDIDGNGRYDALTDAMMILRYLFGLTGNAIVTGAIATDAKRTTAEQVTSYLAEMSPAFDVDGDGRVDALTDGLVISRYLFGLRGFSLIANVLASAIPPEIVEARVQALIGLTQTISFNSVPPAQATAGGTYVVSASASSRLPVAFSIDAAAGGVCQMSGSTITFTSAGICTINADQPGDALYAPAPTARQSVQVSATSASYATAFANAQNP